MIFDLGGLLGRECGLWLGLGKLVVFGFLLEVLVLGLSVGSLLVLLFVLLAVELLGLLVLDPVVLEGLLLDGFELLDDLGDDEAAEEFLELVGLGLPLVELFCVLDDLVLDGIVELLIVCFNDVFVLEDVFEDTFEDIFEELLFFEVNCCELVFLEVIFLEELESLVVTGGFRILRSV